jgi:hypothetical protein
VVSRHDLTFDDAGNLVERATLQNGWSLSVAM